MPIPTSTKPRTSICRVALEIVRVREQEALTTYAARGANRLLNVYRQKSHHTIYTLMLLKRIEHNAKTSICAVRIGVRPFSGYGPWPMANCRPIV